MSIDKFTAMDQLGDVEVTQYLRECVTIEPMALEEEFVRVPADLAYWGARWADAVKEASLAKLRRNEVEAAIDSEYRAAAAASGEKVTEKVIASRVAADDRMRAIEIDLIESEARAARARAFADAVRAKKDMVVSLGSQVRAEMAANPSLRDTLSTARLVKGV